MLWLYYVQMTGDGRRVIEARHPEAVDTAPLEEDDRAMTGDELSFLRSVGIDVSGKFHIRNEGSGAQRLLRIYAAWKSDPEALHYLPQPEASLHPGIHRPVLEWLRAHGNWVAETCSEMFALCLLRDRVTKGVEVIVVDAAEATAPELLDASATGLPVCRRMVIGADGEFENLWPGGFFNERMKELL